MDAEKKIITVQAVINAPVEQVWKLYTEPEHVMKWNNASEDWHTPRAENDLRVGGKFHYRMEAKDGSSGFDFDGTYEQVKTNELIAYSLTDGRKVEVTFTKDDDARRTKMATAFQAENSRGGFHFSNRGISNIFQCTPILEGKDRIDRDIKYPTRTLIHEKL